MIINILTHISSSSNDIEHKIYHFIIISICWFGLKIKISKNMVSMYNNEQVYITLSLLYPLILLLSFIKTTM